MWRGTDSKLFKSQNMVWGSSYFSSDLENRPSNLSRATGKCGATKNAPFGFRVLAFRLDLRQDCAGFRRFQNDFIDRLQDAVGYALPPLRNPLVDHVLVPPVVILHELGSLEFKKIHKDLQPSFGALLRCVASRKFRPVAVPDYFYEVFHARLHRLPKVYRDACGVQAVVTPDECGGRRESRRHGSFAGAIPKQQS